jgi:Bacterial Ig-like domain (group 1)
MTDGIERFHAPARGGPRARVRTTVTGVLLLLAGIAALVASPARAVVTLPGAPLSVSVGPLGQCQSSYAGAANDFNPATGALGDCGFFLAFPSLGNPAALRNEVFGFAGTNGPQITSTEYTPISPGTVTGVGSPGDPYTLVTTFKVTDAASKLDYALITETTTYVNGDPQFTSTFDVQNLTGQPPSEQLNPDPTGAALKFHAIYAGDLLTDGSDFGTGLFLPGPPRFVGGQNTANGVLGGFLEAGLPSPPWTNYQAGCWDVVPETAGRCAATSPADHGIWAAVRGAAAESPVFDNDIDPNLIDNAAGVSWDNNLVDGLAPGAHASYSIVNRAEIPSGLEVQPAAQTYAVGQTATVTVTAKSSAGVPYANRPIVYSVGSANPKSGSVLTDASGAATIRYVGTAAGADTVQMFLDLAGTGTQTARDPSAVTQVGWLAASPTAPFANSGFRVQRVRASSNGTIKITFVPAQDGTATLEVTAPTASISRADAIVAKRRCKSSQLRIRGRCRPRNTPVGKASHRGRAGIALTIEVAPSQRVRKALAKGRTFQLNAKLTYKSVLGGKATARTFHVKVKGKRKHHS